MESFVHPRSRGTSVNKRRNIFLTRPLPPLPRYCSERGIQIFKHENIRGRHLHELCIRRVHRRVSGPHCSPLCSLRRLSPPPLSSLFLRFFLGPFSRNPCFLLRRLTNFYRRRRRVFSVCSRERILGERCLFFLPSCPCHHRSRNAPRAAKRRRRNDG